jgi:hypothetical protein
MPQQKNEPCPECGSLLDVTGAPIFASRTCPVCAAQIHVNRRFGHYELLAVMGQGGQGTVFRARDENLDRPVALKVLRMEHGGDPKFVKQFVHEAQITASINHPNVVRVFSSGATDDGVFLAMELVDGGTLDGLMEKLGRVPAARVLQIGVQIAEGLRAGLEKGLIHRDVKPGNILFAQDGTAKIVDFGLAVFLEYESQATGDIWGTPYYLSPERLNRQQEDFRSDIYSLGATLFHAIAGRPPFEAEDASHVALKHLKTQAVSIQTFAPDVTNATAYVINRTLAKNRDERQASYDEFIEQLQFAREEVMARNQGRGPVAASARVVMEDEPAKRAMGAVAIATFVVLVLGLVVAGLLLKKMFRGDGNESDTRQQAGPAVIESFGPGWGEAKGALLKGEWSKAAAAFQALQAKHPAGSTERDWAIVHEALAEQFGKGGTAAEAALGKIPDTTTQLRKFFREKVRTELIGGGRIRPSAATGFDPRNHESLGVLFFALHDYELGDVDAAGQLFSQFAHLNPDSTVAWLGDYRKLAKRYQDEFVTFNLAADAWKNARNEREQFQALGALRGLQSKLPADSKLKKRAGQLSAEAEKRVGCQLAYKAKATASGSDKNDKPEKAIDGDLATRWTAIGPGQKWLALDLGSPKNVSRWVIRAAGSNERKPEQNLSDFALQRSDDGSQWSDVDKVIANRCDMTDRVVPQFSARHVRVLITKEAKSPKDKTARIQEFALGAASEQAGVQYDPTHTVAVRFSPATDFVAGPIGDIGATGNVKADEKVRTFAVTGGNGDIGAKADGFHFTWQPVEGDCEIVARVEQFQPRNSAAKAGLMIRADLAKDAAAAGVFVQQGDKVQFIKRNAVGAAASGVTKQGLPAPRWLKVTRAGATIAGFESQDGQKWTEIGRVNLASVEGVVFAGIAACSKGADQPVTARFSGVEIRKAKP